MFGNVNIAIMGAGNIAATMANTLKRTRKAKLYAIASRDQKKADEFAHKYGFKKAYGSYADLAADKKVGLIYIATPISEHYENAKMCLEAGKAVLVEKAFTVNAEQAEELIRIAKEKNVFLAEAIWTRYMPFNKTIREVLDSGVIGKPVMLTANLGYPLTHVQRMIDPDLAGGALLDLGVYPLNFASMFFGDAIEKISAAASYTEEFVDEQDGITITYKDGKVANLMASMSSVTDRRGVIYGDKGYVVVENINDPESLTVYDSRHKKVAKYKRPRQKTGYEYEVIASIQAINAHRIEPWAMPHEQTLKIMRLMDEIRSQTGVYYPFEKKAIEQNHEMDTEEKNAEAAAPAEEASAVEEVQENAQVEQAAEAAEAVVAAEAAETVAEAVEAPAEAAAEAAETVAEAVDAPVEAAEEAAEAVVEAAEAAEEVAEAPAEAAAEAAETVAEATEVPVEAAEAVAEAAEEVVEAPAEAAAEATEAVAEAAEEVAEAPVEAAAEATEAVAEAVEEVAEAPVEAAAEATEAVADEVEEVAEVPVEAAAEAAKAFEEAVEEVAEAPVEAAAEAAVEVAEAVEAPVEEAAAAAEEIAEAAGETVQEAKPSAGFHWGD
ncbi:MAG: Gfo/Idh/MocA family oxidoreductase [Lachnospiraceae bacterium]|nr:Gfo/Idh/MocA family oxidoreductase [Lachnospiraceae bacterium]